MTSSAEHIPTDAPVSPNAQEGLSVQDSFRAQDMKEPTPPPSERETEGKETEQNLEQSQSEPEYQIKCPEFIPQDEVEAHRHAFKEAGIDADKAQQVVDQLVRFGEENEKRYVEKLEKSLEEDKRQLQKELGSDYEARQRDISRYFYQENISDEDVKSLVSTWGFQKTFRFFDRYAQMHKESSVGETFAKKEGASSQHKSYDKFFSDPKFSEKLANQDADALQRIREWAMSQAVLE